MRDKDLAVILHEMTCHREHPSDCAWALCRWDAQPRRDFLALAQSLMRRLPEVPWREVNATVGHT